MPEDSPKLRKDWIPPTVKEIPKPPLSDGMLKAVDEAVKKRTRRSQGVGGDRSGTGRSPSE